jgi:hypothetical protein
LVKIHHEFDPSEHFNHPTNVILRNHNFIIRTLFKNTREQQALTNNPVVESDELRLKQVSEIAAYVKIKIPGRFQFDSNKAIREFINSRQFITDMKLH